MHLRKQWDKTEVEQILIYKKEGLKNIVIGNKFGVSANAIRKAIQRYIPEFIPKSKISSNEDPKYVTYNAIILWARKNNISNLSSSTTQNIIMINKVRRSLYLPIFILKS